MKITFLPKNTSKIYLQVGHSYRKPLNIERRLQALKKTSSSPWNEIQKKTLKKRERKEKRKWDRDLHLREAAVKKEKFLHTQKPPHG